MLIGRLHQDIKTVFDGQSHSHQVLSSYFEYRVNLSGFRSRLYPMYKILCKC